MLLNYDEIKNSIKKSGKLIYWFNSNNKLLVVDSSKSLSKKKITKIKYDGLLYRLSITFHTGTKIGQGGQLSIICRLFHLKNNKLIKIDNDGEPLSDNNLKNKNGVIWFEKRWLERRGKWNDKWLEMIIKKLCSNFQFKIGIYLFTDLF